jgi:hypothetical protein
MAFKQQVRVGSCGSWLKILRKPCAFDVANSKASLDKLLIKC